MKDEDDLEESEILDIDVDTENGTEIDTDEPDDSEE